MYKSQKINLDKLFTEAPDHLIYRAWKQAENDANDCWGMGSELLMYDDELHNSCEDDLKALTEIVLRIQSEMDKRDIKYKKTIVKIHEPQYANLLDIW